MKGYIERLIALADRYVTAYEDEVSAKVKPAGNVHPILIANLERRIVNNEARVDAILAERKRGA